MDAVQDFDTCLRDGRSVHIRSTRPTDEAEFLQAFERLSNEARYMRFMRVVHVPNLERLRQVLASFPEKGIGLVATTAADDGIDIVGSAVAVLTGEGHCAEFAITVAGDYAGTGLATKLMSTLIDAARRRGLAELEGFVLSVNQPMLRLAARLGFTIAADPEDGTVRICRLQLGLPATAAPDGSQPASSGP